jgi:N-acetylmuramoyl-L-alanine amidase
VRCVFIATWALAAVLLAVAWPDVARAADVASRYQAAVKEFTKLRDDPGSNGRRDLWRALDAKLSALAKEAGTDPLGANSLYYQAWTNAELAKRSCLDADYEAAAALYKRVAETYPKHAWADDALLRRATILLDNLKKPAEAKTDLEQILRQYPKGDMAGQAKTLLGRLGDVAATGPSRTKTGKSAPTASTGPPPAAPAPSAGPPPATSARPATLSRVAVDPSGTGGQLTLTLDRETTFRYQLLDQKRSNGEPIKRLYIDLDNTRTGKGVPTEKHYDKGTVSRIRAGYFTPETVRVVLELEDVRQYEIHSETGPFRVILDLTGAPAAQAAKAQEYRAQATNRGTADDSKLTGWLGNIFRSDQTPPPETAPQTSKTTANRETRGTATPAPPSPTPGMNFKPPADVKNRAGNLVEQFGLSVRTIMIDPGHGGKDPGAHGLSGVVEKDVNLQFAKILGETLAKKGFKILYTRTTDVFIPLETRTEMANTKGADLFVSIHCNAHGDTDTSGLETYSLNLANSRDAVRVAARENASSQKKISDLQAILTDLMLSAKTSESKDLARFVQKRAVGEIREKKYAIRDRGPHEAPFFVLIGANMPAVLVELGYITNADEAKRLSSEAYMHSLAQGMADGIAAYKKRIERYANL